MTRENFIKKYCWAPKSAADCHQITWDLLEEIQEKFEDIDTPNNTIVDSILYNVDNILEIVDEDLLDCDFLLEIKEELLNMKN